ncbi:MAG TPA: ATP-binding protein [Chroococcales cyanobacterium]
MKIEEFACKIEEWLSHVARLQQHTDRVAAATGEASQLSDKEQQLLIETSEELYISSEELHVAQEELLEQHEQLLQQNLELMAAREALEAERRRYQELFELAPDGYLVTDAKGKIQEANRAAAKMLNIETRFLVGKVLSFFIAREELQRFLCQLSQLNQVDQVQEWEVRLQPRQGKPFDAALSVSPVRDSEGESIALRWLLRDITERKRMEEQHRLLAREQAAREAAQEQGKRSAFLAEASRLLASSLNYRTSLVSVAQLAVSTFADWCFIDLVENNLASFGKPVVAASGSEEEALILELKRRYSLPFNDDDRVARVLQTGEPEVVAAILDSFLLSVARDAEHLELLRQLNAKSYILVPLIAHERKLGAIVFISAQPERHYSSVDLMMAVELAQRVAIAIDNGQLFQEAQEANRIKDEFLAIVSHELRTPLNAILGWSQMLRNRKLNDATIAKAVETIERNAKSQGKLIEDILDISRIIRGKLQLNIYPVHLLPVINAVIENVRPTAEIKNIQIDSILDPSVGQVMGDPERLQQIIWNLLSNAIKFTPRGGRVEVRLEQSTANLLGCPCAEIAVKDTGKGISPNFLPFVFERFRQADGATTRSHGGLGLGLAIVRQLVDMHNGIVSVASEGGGRGATFTVQLPIINARTVQPNEPNDVVLDNFPSLNGLRVLVVDDAADTLELIEFILKQCQAQVTTATSAAEAFAAITQSGHYAIANSKPDILISDIGMPEEDGYSLISRIRVLEAEQETPLPAIALTAFAREEERTRALNAGFQMHIPKPVEPKELVAAVASLAGRSH